jgi:putative sporulation protein YtaF
VKEYHLTIILLMAVSCNLDNLGIGIAYGARGVSIPFVSNLLIAGITTLGTYVSAVFGHSVYLFLKPDIAKYTGAAILICAGIWVVLEELLFSKRNLYPNNHTSEVNLAGKTSFIRKILMILDNPFIADQDLSNYIDVREGIALGLALSLNNIANGIGAGMIGLNIMWLMISIFIISIVTIWIGIKIGNYYGRRIFGKLTGLAAGVFIVLIGIYEIFF